VKHAVPGKLGYLYYFNVGRFIWNFFFGVFQGIFFTDIEKPEEKNVRFSEANNYSLGAGGRGMGTPHQLRNSDGGSRRSFWRLIKVCSSVSLKAFLKSKPNTLRVIFRISRSLLGPQNDILVAFQGSFTIIRNLSPSLLYLTPTGHCR